MFTPLEAAGAEKDAAEHDDIQAATVEIAIPATLLADLAGDRQAGVEVACTLVHQIHDSEAFDGAHLVPVGRYREVAARLEADGFRRAGLKAGP